MMHALLLDFWGCLEQFEKQAGSPARAPRIIPFAVSPASGNTQHRIILELFSSQALNILVEAYFFAYIYPPK